MNSIADLRAYKALDRQVQGLERRQQQRAGVVENADVYRFRLSPTCPPSTSIHFHGGLAWWPVYSLWPAGFFIPSYTVDLSDTAKVYGDFRFTNANWYRAVLIGLDQDMWPPPAPPDAWPEEPPDGIIYLYRSSDEFETATEAEVKVRELVGDRVAHYSVCMGGAVLRNNGNTAEYNQFLPIESVNRGQSYLFGNRKRYGWELA